MGSDVNILFIDNSFKRSMNTGTKANLAQWLATYDFNWPNEKAVIEACQKPKILLKVIRRLCVNLEPAYIRNVLLQQFGHVKFTQRAKNKAQSELIDLMVIRHIFVKSGAKFKMAQVANVKQNREIVRKILIHIKKLLEWKQKLDVEHDKQKTDHAILDGDIHNMKQQLAMLTEKHEEMIRVKETERPHCNTTHALIEETKKKIEETEQQRHNQTMLKIQERKAHIMARQEVEQIKNAILKKTEEVEILKGQISTNGPQIKRRKIKEMNEIEDLVARDLQISRYLKTIEEKQYDTVREFERGILDSDPRSIVKMVEEGQFKKRRIDETWEYRSRKEEIIRSLRQKNTELNEELQREVEGIEEARKKTQTIYLGVRDHQDAIKDMQEVRNKLRAMVNKKKMERDERKEKMELKYRDVEAIYYRHEQQVRHYEDALTEIGEERNELMQSYRAATLDNNPEQAPSSP